MSRPRVFVVLGLLVVAPLGGALIVELGSRHENPLRRVRVERADPKGVLTLGMEADEAAAPQSGEPSLRASADRSSADRRRIILEWAQARLRRALPDLAGMRMGAREWDTVDRCLRELSEHLPPAPQAGWDDVTRAHQAARQFALERLRVSESIAPRRIGRLASHVSSAYLHAARKAQ